MPQANYSILTFLVPIEQYRVDFPVESYNKVFLCGDTCTRTTNGKSLFANAL